MTETPAPYSDEWKEIRLIVADVFCDYLKQDNIIRDLQKAIAELKSAILKSASRNIWDKRHGEMTALLERAETELQARKNVRRLLTRFIKENKLTELY